VRGALAIALIVSVLAVAAGSAHATSSPTANGSRTSAVGLGSGEIEGASWSASISRPRDPGKGRRGIEDRPCIDVTAQRIGRGGSAATCTFGESMTPGSGALWATISEPNLAETETEMTAVVMVLAPVVAEVKATLVDGAVETIRLWRLTSAQATAAGLKRFRYAGFATAGSWCPARLESFDRDGHRLWQSNGLSKRSCRAGS
jgi:hypothetical protein